MSDLENGTLVQHATLGVGKIVALEANAVHVFFPDSDTRFAAKLRLPVARALLRTDGFEPNSWLEGLSAFALDPKVGRYALAASWLTHDQALERFLAVFPEGFNDPKYLTDGSGRRAARWRAAHERWMEKLGGGEGERLVAEGDLNDLLKRALHVEKAMASLHLAADADAVKDALSADETARPFFAALVELTSVPSPGRARFEKLFAAARDLPVEPAQQWLVATLFPFVASPGRQVLFRSDIIRHAAARLGCDLGDDASPNWQTYNALRAFATQLLERLKPNGARDFVDVETFLYVIATAKRTVMRRTR
jgi:hypothetical protein